MIWRTSAGKCREMGIKEQPKYKQTVTILVWPSLHLTAVLSPHQALFLTVCCVSVLSPVFQCGVCMQSPANFNHQTRWQFGQEPWVATTGQGATGHRGFSLGDQEL